MDNNDVLRRIRYSFELSDTAMITLFGLGDLVVTREEISAWLKREGDPAGQPCSDRQLASFLNGFIVDKRGRKEGAQPVAETRLNNNIIFRKLKIALNLQADEILALLALADVKLSKHELSAFFRQPGHKNCRVCNDQILRNFLKGVQLHYRGDLLESSVES